MSTDHAHRRSPEGNRRLPRRLDKLVASGRLTADEADQLRAAQLTGQAEGVLNSIRARHAAASLRAAVDSGNLNPAEADRILEQIRAGDHTPELRARVRRLAQTGGPTDKA